jgi:hypothetical protein
MLLPLKFEMQFHLFIEIAGTSITPQPGPHYTETPSLLSATYASITRTMAPSTFSNSTRSACNCFRPAEVSL